MHKACVLWITTLNDVISVGVRQTPSEEKVTRISNSDKKMTRITRPLDSTKIVRYANLEEL